MVGVGVGVDESDGDRFDSALRETSDDSTQMTLVERLNDLSMSADAFLHLVGVPQVDEWLRLRPHDPAGETARNERAGDLEDLSVALRHEQSDARTLVLEHRVGRDRRSVHHPSDVGGSDAHALADLLDTDDDGT